MKNRAEEAEADSRVESAPLETTLEQAVVDFSAYIELSRRSPMEANGKAFEIVFSSPNNQSFRKVFLPHSVNASPPSPSCELGRLYDQARGLLSCDSPRIVVRIRDLRAELERREARPGRRWAGNNDITFSRKRSQPRVEVVRRTIEGPPKKAIPDNPAEEVLRPALLTSLRAGRQAMVEDGKLLTMRACQLQALQDLENFLADEKAGMKGYFVLATGAGKTVLFGTILKLLDRPAIIFVPNLVLVQQIMEELMETIGFSRGEIGLINHDYKEFGRKITICTYQSHLRLIEREDPHYMHHLKKISIVVCDEAHKALGEKTSSSIGFGNRKEFNEALQLAFTATPKGVDRHVERFFHTRISTTSYAELAEQVLVPFRVIMLDGYMINGRELINGLVNPACEDQVLEREHSLGKLLSAYLDLRRELAENGEPLHTAAFFNRISQAEQFAEMAGEEGLRTILVTSKQDECHGGSEESYEQLKKAERDLLDGRADMLLTVSKLAEGWNFPRLNCVISAALTSSPRRIVQSAGRASRRIPDKEHTYFIGIDWRVVRTQNRATGAWYKKIRASGITEDSLLPGMQVTARYNLMEAFRENGEAGEMIARFCLDRNGEVQNYVPFVPYEVTKSPRISMDSLPKKYVSPLQETTPGASSVSPFNDRLIRETTQFVPDETFFNSPPHIKMTLERVSRLHNLESLRFLTHHKFNGRIMFYADEKWITGHNFLQMAMSFYGIKEPEAAIKHMITLALMAG